MRRTSLSTILYVALVFLSGGVVGAFAHRLYTLKTYAASPAPSPKPEDWVVKYRAELRSRLSLSADQMNQLDAILASTRERFKVVKTKFDKEAHERARPEMKAIQEDQVQKINELLSETQRTEYQKFRDERAAERKKKEMNNAKPALPPGD